MNKLEVCVIFGGQSPEHDISRKSVTSVINNLNKDKYDISVIGITKEGEWFLYTGDTANIIGGEWEADTENKKKAIISPDAKDKAVLVFEDGSWQTLSMWVWEFWLPQTVWIKPIQRLCSRMQASLRLTGLW